MAAAGDYEIVRQLPETWGELQYRVKDMRENHERGLKGLFRHAAGGAVLVMVTGAVRAASELRPNPVEAKHGRSARHDLHDADLAGLPDQHGS